MSMAWSISTKGELSINGEPVAQVSDVGHVVTTYDAIDEVLTVYAGGEVCQRSPR